MVAAFAAACSTAPAAGSPAAPTGSQAPGQSGEPHQAPELEAYIPAVVGGQPVRAASMRGTEAMGGLTQDVADAIAAAGLSPDGVKVAVGAPEDEAWFISALSVDGLDANLLRDAVIGSDFEVTQKTVGGKNVAVVLDSQYYYVTSNVLIGIVADETVAAEILSQMP